MDGDGTFAQFDSSAAPKRGTPRRIVPARQPPASPIRVVVAEGSYPIREFLTAMLSRAPEVELAAVCRNGGELQRTVERWRPDVVVTDIRMPPARADDGLRVAARLHDDRPEMGVIVLSQYAEPAYALALLDRGTTRRAYLLKERIRNRREFIETIQIVADGGSAIDPVIAQLLIQARIRVADSPVSKLTQRERGLLAEVATGKDDRAIARSLLLTRRAVEKRVRSTFAKLNLADTPDISRRLRDALAYLSEENEPGRQLLRARRTHADDMITARGYAAHAPRAPGRWRA